MRDADLSEADLSEANLVETALYGADLRDADLTGAVVEDEQLAVAYSLVGATMPDGSEMIEERWEEFRSEFS